MQLLGEEWRYGAISRGMRIPRPNDWFSPSQYVVCKIDDMHLPGRVIEVVGDHPPIIKICMYQGRNLCSSHTDGCDSICRKRLLTTADHAGVLNLRDIFIVLESSDPLEPVDPRYGILDHQGAEELFNIIDKLEARQKRGRC